MPYIVTESHYCALTYIVTVMYRLSAVMFLTLVSKWLLAYNVFTFHQRDDHDGKNGIDDENNADDYKPAPDPRSRLTTNFTTMRTSQRIVGQRHVPVTLSTASSWTGSTGSVTSRCSSVLFFFSSFLPRRPLTMCDWQVVRILLLVHQLAVFFFFLLRAC